MNGDDSKSSFFKGIFMNLMGSVVPNVGTQIEPRHTTINETLVKLINRLLQYKNPN
jgi:hypothetical protein